MVKGRFEVIYHNYQFEAYSSKALKSGNLKQARSRHNVIAIDESTVIVVGGRKTRETEVCTLTGQKFTCVKQSPELTDYAEYPELFIVPQDYCQG